MATYIMQVRTACVPCHLCACCLYNTRVDNPPLLCPGMVSLGSPLCPPTKLYTVHPVWSEGWNWYTLLDPAPREPVNLVYAVPRRPVPYPCRTLQYKCVVNLNMSNNINLGPAGIKGIASVSRVLVIRWQRGVPAMRLLYRLVLERRTSSVYGTWGGGDYSSAHSVKEGVLGHTHAHHCHRQTCATAVPFPVPCCGRSSVASVTSTSFPLLLPRS